MAYNISVASLTQQERWEWVNAGIRLVRDEGLRHNPNDLVLHKELAFWFGHKIEGYSDDAHLYYKKQFCREWHFLLGEPPVDWEARVEWIKAIADAPRTLEELIREKPEVGELIDELNASHDPESTMVTTLAQEREINTFFRLTSPTVISKLRDAFPDMAEQPSPREVFLKLRELRNSW